MRHQEDVEDIYWGYVKGVWIIARGRIGRDGRVSSVSGGRG